MSSNYALNSKLIELNEFLSNRSTDIELPDRAQITRPSHLRYEHLAELSDVVWLVLLDMLSRQMRHHSLTSSSPSQLAIQRRLTIMVDLVDRLIGYGVISKQCDSYQSVDQVKKFLEIQRSQPIW